jgi:GTP cyclohydrolase II
MHVPSRVIRPQQSGNVVWQAKTTLPTRHGSFEMHVFREGDGDCAKEHVAMVFGNVVGPNVAVRVHSECMTSEVFGSLKCDCKEQLEHALAEAARRGRGAVLYLRQEGRGIGLTNKVRAYALQEQGYDTVDANRMLGLPDDARNYDAAADMLDYLGIESVALLTNNPEKVNKLRALGVDVVERVPVIVQPNSYSRGYLETKRARMEHLLPNYLAPETPAAE